MKIAGAALLLLQGMCLAQSTQQTKLPPDFEEGEGGSFMRARAAWFYQQRAYPGSRIPGGVLQRALRQLDSMLASRKQAQARSQSPSSAQNSSTLQFDLPWQSIGPRSVNEYGGLDSGRIAAVAVDPTNSNVVYAGAAQGGVWKTSDGGITWTPLTDTQPSLAVGSIAIDPENPATIYVGTGEENDAIDSYYGAGILKSTDGGNTWTNYPGPFAGGFSGGARIGGVAVNPANSQIVLAAIGYGGPSVPGVYRSGDGGNTWINVLGGGEAHEVYFDPANGNRAFTAVTGEGVYASQDGGLTWAPINGNGLNVLPAAGNGRIALAMDPNNTNTLYAAVTNSDSTGLLGVYTTVDGGANWNQLSNVPDYCGSQCWYDNVIAVAPGNSSAIFAGGKSTYPLIYSLDGGMSWTVVTSIHPDLHALAFTADGQKLYAGNDGGMWSTTAIGQPNLQWTSLNATLVTLQFYSGPSLDPHDITVGYGGTQDNGFERFSDMLAWNTVNCGDGGQSAIDFTNSSTVYGTCVGVDPVNAVVKSVDSGNSFTESGFGINDGDAMNWVPPLAMDPGNPQTLYFGTQYIYQTTNGAGSWTAISPNLTNGGVSISIAVSPVDSNTVYAAFGPFPQVYVTTNALAGAGAGWNNISNNNLPERSITAVAADPNSSTTAYLTYSGFSGYYDNVGHVFMTADGGATWNDISGNLPNVPVNDIVIDPDHANTIYIGTDIGAFYTANQGATWDVLGTGFPRVAILGLKLHRATHTLRAATHGRSMWDLALEPVSAFRQVPGSLSSVSVGADGSIWGLNSNGNIFTFNLQTQSWTQVPGALTEIAVGSANSVWGLNSAGQVYRWDAGTPGWDVIPGNLSHIAIGADGDFWGINSAGEIYQFNNQLQTWQQIPGSLTQISAGFDGAIWGLNYVNSVYRFNPGTGLFEQVPGSGSSIAAGSDGDVWLLNAGSVYHFNRLSQNWDHIAGTLSQIAVGSGTSVWGLDDIGQPYQYNAQSSVWSPVGAAPLTQISAGANGSVWGVDSSQNIYQFIGPAQPVQTFQQIPGTLAQIAAGTDGSVWGVNSLGQIYTFNPLIKGWTYMPGELNYIAVGTGESVWGIDSAEQIYHYDPAAQRWDWIQGSLTNIAVGAKGDVWGINSGEQIYRYNPDTNGWTLIPGSLQQISVGADGTVWGLNYLNNIYRFDALTQSWVQSPGTLKQIAVGSVDNVWGINSDDGAYRFDWPSRSWIYVPGVFLNHIAVAFDGAVWGIDLMNQVWRFDTQDQIWVQVPGSLTQITVASDGVVWGLDSTGSIYWYR